MISQSVFAYVDIAGVFVGALTGALVGRRLRYDIMGIWILALVTGLGGGILRDVMLQHGPPLALVNPRYLPTVFVATVVAAVAGSHIEHLRRTINVLDAVSIATFAAAGSFRTIDAGLGPWPTILLGVLTAVGGGLLRDMMTGQTSIVFKRGELYAFAAMGSSFVVLLGNSMEIARTPITVVAIVIGVFLRLGSQKWGWMSWEPH